MTAATLLYVNEQWLCKLYRTLTLYDLKLDHTALTLYCRLTLYDLKLDQIALTYNDYGNSIEGHTALTYSDVRK